MYTTCGGKGRRGSILSEVMIAMNIIVFLIPVLFSAAALLERPDPVYRNIQNRIQMMQCRRLISSGHINYVAEKELGFSAEGKQRILHQKSGWLLIEPGTWILCDKVEDVRFEQREEAVLIHVTTERERFSDVIAYR